MLCGGTFITHKTQRKRGEKSDEKGGKKEFNNSVFNLIITFVSLSSLLSLSGLSSLMI